MIFSLLAPIEVLFDPSSYSVTEGDVVVVLIVLSSPLRSNATVLFTTADGTADGMYYTLHTTHFTPSEGPEGK